MPTPRIRFPRPLRKGDLIAVAAPSSGVVGDALYRFSVLHDVDIGHRSSQMTLINGAVASFVFLGAGGYVAQSTAG